MRKKDQQTRCKVEESERSLFRDAVSDAQPLAKPDRHQARLPPPRPIPRPASNAEENLYSHLLEKEAVVQPADDSKVLEYRKPGLQDSQLRKLRRGKFEREDELDLHGLTVAQARKELAAFLVRCKRRNLRCVRIIHGKGLRSGERGAVLKAQLDLWLRQYDEIQGYCPAQRTEGGSGAVYVLLRSGRTRPTE